MKAVLRCAPGVWFVSQCGMNRNLELQDGESCLFIYCPARPEELFILVTYRVSSSSAWSLAPGTTGTPLQSTALVVSLALTRGLADGGEDVPKVVWG